MKVKYNYLSILLIFFVTLAGCGGGDSGGAPGTSGNTGILIKAVSISSKSPDLDTAIHLCTDGKPEPGLFREDATITIAADNLSTDAAFDAFPASVEECTITYKKANEDPAAPILESLTIYPNCAFVKKDDNVCNVTLIDIARKQFYWNTLQGGTVLPVEYPTHYIAVYKCKYKNNFDKTGYFQVEHDIWLADFQMCAS